MITLAKENRVQTAFRFPESLIDKLKDLAKDQDVSLNEYVLNLLKETTKDYETLREREARLKKTREFLSDFSGSWIGDESSEDILKEIRSGRVERTIIEL